jgi:hypothetical protein
MKDASTSLQDGMLAYYLEQAKFADANVEARIAREPFNLLNPPSAFLDDLQDRMRRRRGLAPLPNIPALMSKKGL